MSTTTKLIEEYLPAEFSHFRKRDIIWLWNYFCLDERNSSSPFTITPDLLESISRKISTHYKNRIDRILITHKNMLLEEKHISWIASGDLRLSLWVCSWLYYSNARDNTRRGGRPYFFNNKLNEIGSATIKDRIFLALDYFDVSMIKKIEDIEYMKSKYDSMRLPHNKTRWIESKNKNQLNWAWQYLIDHDKQVNYLPPSDDEKYHYILASLDLIVGTNTNKETWNAMLDSRDFFISRMRNAWNQQSYRSSLADKKSISLTLSLSAIQKLDEICKSNNISRSFCIEKILESIPDK